MPVRTPASVAVLLAVVLGAPAAAQPPAPPPLPASVKTVEIKSEAVGRTLKYNVVLPEKYDESTDRYPVLYLLHGYSGNYNNWARMNAPKAAKENRLIVVMPDGGNSWYANWAESTDGQKNAWDDFITKELVKHVDSTYRTVASREGRAINGLSMGGYGALTLGLKHPDLYCSVGSESGALGFARGVGERLRKGDDLAKTAAKRKLSDQPNAAIGIEGFSSQTERTPKGKLFATPEQADAYDPFKLVLTVPKEQMPHLVIDCGTEDGLVKGAQEFVKLLMENKIPFTYSESAGGHNGAYWSREIGQAAAVQAEILKRNLAKAAKDKETKSANP